MDNESSSPAPPQHTRRDIIKRTAAGGVAVWAAPAILSVSRAAAASPLCCACDNDATALRVSGTGLLDDIDITVEGDPCVVGPVSADLLSASVLCSETGCAADTCFANASVAAVTIGALGPFAAILSTTDIVSTASAPCDCAAPRTGTTTIANLTVAGINVVPVIVPAGTVPPNTIVGPLAINLGAASGSVTIALNEQTCLGNGQLQVRAVHINLSLTIIGLGNATADIFISESIAGAVGCPC